MGSYNRTHGHRIEEERRVKELKVLAWSALPCQKDFGALRSCSHKRGEVYTDNGTGLGVVNEGSTL